MGHPHVPRLAEFLPCDAACRAAELVDLERRRLLQETFTTSCCLSSCTSYVDFCHDLGTVPQHHGALPVEQHAAFNSVCRGLLVLNIGFLIPQKAFRCCLSRSPHAEPGLAEHGKELPIVDEDSFVSV